MPMLNQFKSQNDLVQYLNEMETRVSALEEINAELRARNESVDKRSVDVITFVKDNWPKTGLVSRNWWIRAFSVYGYFIVIQLIISAILFAVYLFFLAPILANALRTFSLGRLQ